MLFEVVGSEDAWAAGVGDNSDTVAAEWFATREGVEVMEEVFGGVGADNPGFFASGADNTVVCSEAASVGLHGGFGLFAFAWFEHDDGDGFGEFVGAADEVLAVFKVFQVQS